MIQSPSDPRKTETVVNNLKENWAVNTAGGKNLIERSVVKVA